MPRKFAPNASAVVDVTARTILRGEVFKFASLSVVVSSLLVVFVVASESSSSSSSFARLLTSGVFRSPRRFRNFLVQR